MRPSPQAVLLLALSAAWAADGDQAGWRASVEAALADPALVALYAFEAGAGGLVDDRGPGRSPPLLLADRSPYGAYNGADGGPPPDPSTCPRWTAGRWPGTWAVACAAAPVQLRRPGVDLAGGPFTVLAWIRPHAVDTYTWCGGDVLSTGVGWQSGWRLAVFRQKWCRDGLAQLWLGVPTGNLTLQAPRCTFGDWHLLAVSWDGREARLRVDGASAAAPCPGPLLALAPPIPALLVGGSAQPGSGTLGFDIDHLALYRRALGEAELDALATRFRPGPEATRPAAPAVLAALAAFPVASGGCFPRGSALRVTLQGSAPAASIRLRISDRAGGATLFTTAARPAPGTELVFTPDRCGLFLAELELLDAEGTVQERQAYPIAVTVPPADGAEGRFVLGVRQGAWAQPEARLAGFRWCAATVDWRMVEPVAGLYRWDTADAVFAGAAGSGLPVYCTLAAPPSWAHGAEPAARLVRLLASRYRGQIAAWRLAPELGEAVRAAAHAAIRAETPAARILAGPGQAGCDGVAFEHAPTAARPGGAFTAEDLPPALRAPAALRWNAACSCAQSDRPLAALAGEAGMGAPFRAGGAQGLTVRSGCVLAPPDAAAWLVREALAEFAAGVDSVFLADPLAGFQPIPASAAGAPSERVPACAALAAQLAQATAVEAVDAGALVRAFRISSGQDRPPVLAVFTQDGSAVTGTFPGAVTGCDWLGNPLPPGRPDADGSTTVEFGMRPVYLRTAAIPRCERAAGGG